MTDKVTQPGAEPPASSGRLPAEARRALVELMRQGVVFAENRRLVFDALCTHRVLIEDYLADIYLRMLIDEHAGLALLLSARGNAEADDKDLPSLISRRALTLYDSVLLIVLRKHFLDRENAGDVHIRIDIPQLEALMAPFLPLSTSTSSERRKLHGSIETLKRRRILNAVRGEDERVEISPVIRYVVNAEYLEHLLSEYRRLAAATIDGAAGMASTDADKESSDDEA